ncbi:MAG TPA: SGNH/GDSL hydrolase family protein [Planctomycetota bacterium]
MKARRGAWIALATLALALGALELGFRLLTRDEVSRAIRGHRRYLLSGEMRAYEPRAHTVYQMRPGGHANSFGFYDRAWTRARTPGVPRVLCLGGSTTQGGNALGRKGAYPHQLEVLLEARLARDVEVLNAGIAGWSTAEMLVSWFLTLQDFRPDVLVLHEAVNDLPARFLADFEPDYSHWRTPVRIQPLAGPERWLVRVSDLYVGLRLRRTGAPELADVSTRSGPPEPLLAQDRLPPETALPFRRNLRSIATSAQTEGTQVVLMTLPCAAGRQAACWGFGIAENNRQLRALASEEGLLLADAERLFEEHPELATHFLDGVHLDPEGDRAKAELLVRTLTPWLASLPAEGGRPPDALAR